MTAYFIRKLVESLLLPIGFWGVLSLFGMASNRRWLVGVGFAVIYAFSTPMGARLVITPLEHVYEPRTVESCAVADAIVVLSGDVVRGEAAPGVQWGESANRYFSGFDLARAGKAKVLIFSNGTAVEGSKSSEGSLMRQTAIRDGISPERILVTGRVFTTSDEAEAVSRIPGIHDILLVTSAFHMARAAMLFRAAGLKVSPFPTDFRALGHTQFSLRSLVISASALSQSESALREYYGLLAYRLILLIRPGALQPAVPSRGSLPSSESRGRSQMTRSAA